MTKTRRNIFIERLWRSLKHEDIYLKHYADGREAKAGNGEYFAFYNERRLRLARAAGRLARRRGAASLWTCRQRMRLITCP